MALFGGIFCGCQVPGAGLGWELTKAGSHGGAADARRARCPADAALSELRPYGRGWMHATCGMGALKGIERQ